jgi:outer membrane protein TolC
MEAASRALSLAWNDLVPSLSVGASASRSSGQGGVSGSASASLSLSAESLNARSAAELAYDAAELAYETTRRDVELSVRTAFYALLLNEEKIRLAELNAATARKSYEQAEARRVAGVAPELDALSALVKLEKLGPALDSARIDYESALDSFRRLLGLERGAAVTLSGSLDAARGAVEGAAAVDPTAAASSSPSVRALELSKATAERSLAKARRSVYSPSLSLSASYRPSLSDASLSGSGSLSASLSLGLDDMLPWSDARLAVASAEDAVAKLDSQLADAKASAVSEAAALQRTIAKAARAIETGRLSESLAERTYALTEEAYRFGTEDLLSLQGAQDDLAEARLAISEDEYALITALLELEYALGEPFGSLGRK